MGGPPPAQDSARSSPEWRALPGQLLQHVESGLCLSAPPVGTVRDGKVSVRVCSAEDAAQHWVHSGCHKVCGVVWCG